MKLAEAQAIAERVQAELSPYCEPGRCCIGGSIRRKSPEPNDLEIICVPKTIPGGLFKDRAERDPDFLHVVNRWFAVKGDAATGKYTQRILPEGIKVDLFMPTLDTFGVIYAIRTGSAEYSHQVLAKGWTRLGYESRGGVLWKDGQPTFLREERKLFDLLGIPWCPPELREI